MPKFLIERHIPGIENWGGEQMKAVARKSNDVLADLGTHIQWVHSYVVPGKMFCIYIATDEAIIREHARMGGFPCNSVTPIRDVLDPTTSERRT